jgi:hypothetical protein
MNIKAPDPASEGSVSLQDVSMGNPNSRHLKYITGEGKRA